MINDVQIENKSCSYYIEESASDIELPKSSDITQHHMYAKKLEPLTSPKHQPPAGESVIEIPGSVESTSKQSAAAVAAAAEALGDKNSQARTITVKVEFSLLNLQLVLTL